MKLLHFERDAQGKVTHLCIGAKKLKIYWRTPGAFDRTPQSNIDGTPMVGFFDSRGNAYGSAGIRHDPY